MHGMKQGVGHPEELKCIFFVKFHSKLGPEMRAQCPQKFISAESFKSFDPKDTCPVSHLCQKVVKFAFGDLKIVGYPIWLFDLSKYGEERRGVLRFNVCFVFSYESITTRYDSMLVKLANCFCRLEAEQNFVTNLDKNEVAKNEEVLQRLISDIFNGLQTTGFCYIKLPDSTMLGLKPEEKRIANFKIQICDVPILLYTLDELDIDRWDLISVKVLEAIDGLRNVKEIISLVNAESSLVLACLSYLKTLKYVALSSTFRDSNLYLVTPKLDYLSKDVEFQQLCCRSVKAEGNLENKEEELEPVAIHNILRAFSLISNNLPLNKIDMEVQKVGIDVRKLVQFGVTNGILKKLYKYPFLINNSIFDELTISFDSGSTKGGTDTTILAGNLTPDGTIERGARSARTGNQSRTYSRNKVTIGTEISTLAPRVTVTQAVPDFLSDDRIQFIRGYLDGSHHTEELACVFNVDVDSLESMLESCDTVLMYMK